MLGSILKHVAWTGEDAATGPEIGVSLRATLVEAGGHASNGHFDLEAL